MLDFTKGVSAASLREDKTSTKRPRIWFINRFFWPDVSATSQMLSDLAFQLAENGFDVSVIASSGMYADGNRDLPRYERHRGVEIHRVKRPRFGRSNLVGRSYDCASMYVRFAWALAKRAQRGDIVVVKTDPPILSGAIAPVARTCGLHQVNWLQDLYPEVATGLGVTALKPITPLLLAIRDWSLRGASLNVAIGERMADNLRARGVEHDSIAVIHNWCDDAAILPKPVTNNSLRAAWGLEGKFVVGYSGNLGRAHECDTLLEAAEQLKHNTDIVFLFIGGGLMAEKLKQKVRERKLEHAFQFQPYQPSTALPESLCAPDVHWISLRPEMEGLILPSKFYGVAAAGRPTIAVSDLNGELAKLVSRNRCGIAVRPGDGPAFASAILALRADERLRNDLGRNARLLLETRLKRSRAFTQWRDSLNFVARGVEQQVGEEQGEVFAVAQMSPLNWLTEGVQQTGSV
jgi:colanic acid biosynthesis glycosyl transferase WcaI